MAGGIAGADRSPAAQSQPPWTVSLASFAPCVSPSPRRLSSCFRERGRPVLSARKQLAWVSLQGLLIGGEEATSAKAIGGSLGLDEAIPWELFSPLHRVLIVAVMAVATAESKRSKKISQLQRSVDLRDQVLQGMQQKLDDLCMQMSVGVDWPIKSNNMICPENDAPSCLKLPKLNPESGITPLFKNSFDKPKEECMIESSKNEMFKSAHVNNSEQEERRMSDLSDFCASVTSSVDIQLSTLAAEQDYFNLRRECEEKDSTIKELTTAIHASGVVSSKRITELEEIIRRKNMVISKMKKDMLILEQQIIQLTRLRRKSAPALSNSNDTQLPFMSSNILYDMSSTSPSSSDSDSPSGNTLQSSSVEEKRTHSQPSMKMNSVQKSVDKPRKQQCLSPLKENNMNQRTKSNETSRSGQLGPSSGDLKRIRRRAPPESRTPISQRKWV